MNVVEINPVTKTYRGPWVWPDGSILINTQLLLADAEQLGYTAELVSKPIPEAVPTWALLATVDSRGYRAAVESAIENMPTAMSAKFRWLLQRGDVFPRDGALINSVFNIAMNLTPGQVDDLFIEAQILADNIV